MLAADRAEAEWVKVVSNQEAAGYDTYAPVTCLADPVWPNIGIEAVIEMAFRSRIIDSIDHPVLNELRGQEG